MKRALIDVLTGKAPERRPVWFMRQAGRYLPEYRALRAEAGSFLNLCYDPVRACEVTLQPLRRFDLDAAILFSDILVVPHALGLSLRFAEGEGPILQTVGSAAEVARLAVEKPGDQLKTVAETVALVRASLAPEKTLIGFCGAPWTVASYMIEGGSSKRAVARQVAAENPAWFADLLQKLVDVSVHYLALQVEAGANCLQIFDSWAGDLDGETLKRCVFRPIAEMRRRLKERYPDVPVIGFARGIGEAQADFARATEVDGVSVEDDRVLAEVLKTLPSGVAVQGNLSPQSLLAGGDVMRAEVASLLRSLPKDRHIFNLGHGIVPQTPIAHVAEVVAMIRAAD